MAYNGSRHNQRERITIKKLAQTEQLPQRTKPGLDHIVHYSGSPWQYAMKKNQLLLLVVVKQHAWPNYVPVSGEPVMMMIIVVVMTMLTIALTKDSPPSIWIGLRSRNKWAARNSCQHKSLLITQIICWLLVVVEENWKRAAQLDGQLKEGKTLSPHTLTNHLQTFSS